MALSDDLVRIAAVAAEHAEVEGVLAAEPALGVRRYLIAYGGEPRTWLVLDDDGRPVDRRDDVRDVASIIAVCELADDVAGYGEPPRVASPAYLDEVGAAALEQERARGEVSSPFGQALR